MFRYRILPLLFLFNVIWLAGAPGLWAVEASIGVAPVYWQYEELSPQRAGYTSTPFTSTAKGWGLQLNASLEQAWDYHPDWSVRVDASGMLPLGKAEEIWQLTGGASVQNNKLDIRQAEGRAVVLRRLGLFQVGLWGSYQWQQQRRQQFVVNGAAVVVAGEPVRESISSAWVGGELDAGFGSLKLQFEGGLPAWVEVTNSTLSGKFNRRSGYRWGASVNWQAIETAAVDFIVRVNYQYRKLGGDLKSFGLWPDNRYETLAAGVALHW